MKNKFLFMLIVVSICIFALGAISASAATYGDLTYKVSNGEVTITDCDTYVTSVIVPETIGGYPVTSIGNEAFSNCISLTSITIPDSVTSIGDRAFGNCASLTSITIPNSVTSIGDYAFGNCASLTSIIIPDSVTSISSYAFRDCSCLKAITVDINNPNYLSDEHGALFNKDTTTLIQYPIGKTATSYHIPDSVTSIVYRAFYNCKSLTSITIPDGVTSIGRDAFYYCTSLTSITIPDSVTSIGSYAFYNTAYYNKTSNWKNGVLYIGNHLIDAKNTLSGGYSIREGTKTIAEFAFSGCASLTSITIPNSVTSIGDYAFGNCASLTSVTIGNGVESIGDSAFGNCASLTSVTIGNGVESIGDSAFKGCTSLESVYITDLEAYLNCRYEGYDSNPMEYASKLYINNELPTSIEIPNTVTKIPGYAFYNCTSLTSVTIGNGVESIGYYAFYRCTRLKSITIGNSVKSIGYQAFYNCKSLKSINIPDSVTYIGDSAFYDCTSLESVYITDLEAYLNCSYGSTHSNPMYYASKLYINNELPTSIEIPNTVTKIPGYAFKNCTSLTSITIPDSVTSIGYDAFSGCTSLESVYITDLEAYLNCSYYNYTSNPMYYASNLYTLVNNEIATSIEIPNTVTKIPAEAFEGCKNLTSITIPDSVTSIGEDAFSYCTSLTSVTIGNGVKSIGEYAFRGCTSLTSVTIGNGVKSIGEDAFEYCTKLDSVYITDLEAYLNCSYGNSYSHPMHYASNLYINNELATDIKIPDTVTMIPVYAFYDCECLTSITIPDSVTIIDDETFRGCTNLTSITIPNSVTSIGERAFYGCTNLSSITIPDSVTSIGNYFFRNCTSLTTVTIGNGVESIGDGAFYNCTSLTSITIPDSVKSIGDGAFEDCTSLTSITIPDSVTSIGDNAFEYCRSLTSITIHDSVTSIGRYAFDNTSYYKNESNWKNDVLYIGNHLIKAKDTLSGSYGIREGTKTIAEYAFYNCTSLEKVTILSRDVKFGFGVFSYCDENKPTLYGYKDSTTEAYAKQKSIKFVAIDEPVICAHTWNAGEITTAPTCVDFGKKTYTCTACGATNVENVPKAPHSFGEWVVTKQPTATEKGEETRTCTACEAKETRDVKPLSDSTNIIAYGKCGESLSWVLYGDGRLEIIGKGNMTSFESASKTPWSEYINEIKFVIINDGATSIGAYAFTNCSMLEKAKLPSTLEAIEHHAFGKCSSLKEIDIPESVKTIGYYCFNYCTSLERVTFGGVVENIGSNAFISCSSLKEIIFADGTESIGNGIFYNCTALEKIVIPESVTSIGSTAFDGCDSLTIYGYTGSYAQTYASENDIPFVALDEHTCTYSGDWVIEREATIFVEGLKYRICDVCRRRTEEVIPKLVIDITQNENYGMAHFTVVDATNPSTVISGVKVVIKTPNDGEGTFITNSEGKFSAILPVGKLTATVSKDGYITRNLKLSITPGEKEIPKIGISTEELVEAGFDYKEMNLEEIIAAGIDITAPDNHHVYKYKIDFEFTPDAYDLEFFFDEKGKFIGHGYFLIQGDSDDPDDPDTPKYPNFPYDPSIPLIPGQDYYPPYVPAPDEPDAPLPSIKIPSENGEFTTTICPVKEWLYLIVHGEAKWLKEMHDIEMYIINNSLTDTVEDCTAAISLPDGLSLATMIAEIGEQSLAQTVDYIKEGGTKSIHWYVRGDKEGEYNVAGTLDGILMPFEEKFHYDYELDSPIKVYAGSALHMTIYAPEAAYYGEDYNVRVEFQNVSHKAIYGFTNSILGIKQCKFTRYSNGEMVEEIHVEENKTQKTILDTFNPGDKVVIEISSNILFRSEIILDKLEKLSAEIDGLEFLIDSYRAVNKNSLEIDRADGYIKKFIEQVDAEAKLENNQARKASLNSLKLALDTVYAKFLKNDIMALNVVNGFKLYGCYDDLIIYVLGIESLDLLSAEKAEWLCGIMNDISGNIADTEEIFAALRNALQIIPMRFVLEDVTVVTLEGSTTEIPYSVKVIPDTNESYSDFVNISNNIKTLVENAAGALDIPWFARVINSDIIVPKQSISFNEKAFFAAKSATGETKYKAWVERADEVSLAAVEDDFALSSDAEDATVENGVLTFTGTGYVEIASLTGNSGILNVEITEGTNTKTIRYNLNVVDEHICHSDEWKVLINEDYMSDGFRIKICSECEDFIDAEVFRTKQTGDLDGDGKITDSDAIYLMYYTFFPEEYQTNQLCDFDGDGMVTDNDAIYLMYHTFFPEEYSLSN